MKIFVNAPPHRENSGGCVVLYKLVGLLNAMGFDSGIVLFGDRADVKDSDWVVYPEVVEGNPLGAKNVVRWVLNEPGVIDGNERTWGVDDVVCLYSGQFCAKRKSDLMLTICNYRLDYFTPTGAERSGAIYAKFKGKKYFDTFDKHPSHAQLIDGKKIEAIKAMMDRARIFYSYDNESFYNVMAAMMGCLVVVIPRPDKEMDQTSFCMSHPAYMYGIAYGEENVAWATSTQIHVRRNIDDLDMNQRFRVMDFANYLEAISNGKRGA